MAMFCYSSGATCLVPFPSVTSCMLLIMLRGIVDHRWRGAMWRRLLRWRGVARRLQLFRQWRGAVLRRLLQWRGVARRLRVPRQWRGAMLRRLLRWRGVARRLRVPRQWLPRH